VSENVSRVRKRMGDLSLNQLVALIEGHRRKMKEHYYDDIAMMVAKNKLLRLEKELERRKASKEKGI